MKKNSRLRNEEIAAFCRQTALIYKAGITPSQGMGILKEDTLSKEGKQLLDQIGDYCQKGNKLYEALESTGVFPSYVVSLVALGEEAGKPEEVLVSLAEYYEHEQDVSDGIKSAVTYPLIMIAMMLLIIIVLVVKVLPIFKQVFVQLGSEMTPFAEKMMNIGNVLSKYSIGITVAVLVIIIALFLLFRIPSLKKGWKNLLSKLPVTKDFFNNVATSRLASAMFLGISSGMNVDTTLNMARELVENPKMEEKIDIVKSAIADRATMTEALMSANVFSNLYTKMIDIGEKAGSQEEIFKMVAEHYDEATNKQLHRILSIIEPTLVIVLSVIVGVILLSVLLPLMGIMSSIG